MLSVRDYTMDKVICSLKIIFEQSSLLLDHCRVIIVVIYELIQSFGNVTNGVKALKQSREE